MANLKGLVIGSSEAVETLLAAYQNDLDIERCSDKGELKSLMRASPVKVFNIIICAGGLPDMGLAEVGQTLTMLYTAVPIFYLYENEAGLDKRTLKKNGFTDSFLLPSEEGNFKEALQKMVTATEAKLFAPIRLVDVSVDTEINFEIRVFLPKNNRFVPYIKPGDQINESRLKRLNEFRKGAIFVPVTDLENFYDFSALRLLELSPAEGPSSPDSAEHIETSVRELTLGLLNESYAKALSSDKKDLDHSRKVIDLFLALKYPGGWQSQLQLVGLGNPEALEQSFRVSSFAVLFAMAFQEGDQKELATAGLLLDLGIGELPPALQKTAVNKMTPDEFDLYKTHPELSVRSAEEQGIELSDLCREAIQQHHESWGGGGFPFDLSGSSLSCESQTIALASRFEELTRANNALTPLLPEQAVAQMEQEGIAAPKYLQKLRKIFFNFRPAGS